MKHIRTRFRQWSSSGNQSTSRSLGLLRGVASLFLFACLALTAQTPREAQAIQFLQNGRVDEAQQLLTKLLQENPKNQPVHALLGQIAFGKQDYAGAISHFQKAPAFLSNNPVLLLSYAEALLTREAKDDAVHELSKLQRGEPEAHFEAGLLLARFGLYGPAEIQFQMAKTARYRDASVLAYNLALTQYRAGRFVDSASTLEELRKTQTLDADALNLLGQSYLDAGNSEPAESVLKSALGAFPKDERNYLALAKLAIDTEKLDMGLVVLDQGLKQLDNSYALHMQRGYLRLSNGYLTDAETDYRHAIELKPESTSPKIGLAFVLLQNQRQAEATEILNQVLSIKPNFFVHYLMAELRIREGSDDEALSQLQASAKLEPKFSPTHTNLGKLLLKKKEIPQAIEELELAVKLDPDDATAYYQLSTAYRLSSQREKAQQALARVKELNKEQRELGTTRFITRRLQKVRTGESWAF